MHAHGYFEHDTTIIKTSSVDIYLGDIECFLLSNALVSCRKDAASLVQISVLNIHWFGKTFFD